MQAIDTTVKVTSSPADVTVGSTPSTAGSADTLPPEFADKHSVLRSPYWRKMRKAEAKVLASVGR